MEQMFKPEGCEIYFVRHGQPEWAVEGKAIDEPGLTALGLAAAERVGERLGGLKVTDFFVSGLRRARMTAAPLAERLGRQPRVLPWFNEFQAKKMQDDPLMRVDEYFSQWRAVPLAERYKGPEGGETFAHLHQRVTEGIDSLMRELGFSYVEDGPYRRWNLPAPEKRIIFVGHTFASGVAAAHLLGFSIHPHISEQLRMGWGAFNRLVPFRVGGGFVWRLRTVDERGHLLGLPCDDE